MTSHPSPDVTVVICTKSRPKLVTRALTAVEALDPRPAAVLVIDNAPEDNRTYDVVHRFTQARYVREPAPGLNHARNRAIGECQTEIAAFLDDDSVPAPEWVGVIEERFRSPKLGACVSRVEPYGPPTPGQRLFELAGGLSRGDTPVLLPSDRRRPLRGIRVPLIAWAVELGVGCGLAVRTEMVQRAGGFDPLFGTGAPLPGGDETDVLWRLMVAGCDVAYEPNARVFHEHRQDRESVARQLCGYQRGTSAFLFKSLQAAPVKEKGPILFTLLWRLLKPGYRLARKILRKDPLAAMLLVKLGWNSLTGPLIYLAARRSDSPAADPRSIRGLRT
jgi:GT2 family glycosyltransferase